MSKIIDSYTATQITVHLSQDFRLRLLKPNEKKIADVINVFSLNEGELDSDDDFIGAGGIIPSNKKAMLRGIKIFLSRNVIEITCLGGLTKHCFESLYISLEKLYGVSQGQVEQGIDYIDYETVTKVELNTSIYSIFSQEMQDQINQWKNLDSGEVINVNDNKSWDKNDSGIIDISREKYEKLYSGQNNALVVPSQIKFTIVVPTNYGKTSQHEISIAVQSVDEFYENIYFLKSELPYNAHVKLIETIESI